MNQTTSHSSVPFFEMPVALKFKNATQEKIIVVNNTSNGQQFIQPIGFIPDTVLVDPEYWIISKNNSTQKTIFANSGEGIAEIYPNPIADPLSIFLHDFNANTASIKILAANGQLMYKRSVALLNGAELCVVPTKQWARGMYIIYIEAAGKKIVKQVVR